MKCLKSLVTTISLLVVTMPVNAGLFSKKPKWNCMSPDDPDMEITYYGKGQASVLKQGFLYPGSYPVKVVDENTVTGENRFGDSFICTRPSKSD